MCGVIGFATVNPTEGQRDLLARVIHESRVRGLHAFGLAWFNRDGSGALRSHDLKTVSEIALEKLQVEGPAKVIAHCRYSTSGDWLSLANAQPLTTDRLALAFNGVISMKTKPEFEAEFNVKCRADNDGEILLRKVEQGEDPKEFVRSISGSFAGVMLDLKTGWVTAFRNSRRPLWKAEAAGANFIASTRNIFERAGIAGAVEIQPGETWAHS